MLSVVLTVGMMSYITTPPDYKEVCNLYIAKKNGQIVNVIEKDENVFMNNAMTFPWLLAVGKRSENTLNVTKGFSMLGYIGENEIEWTNDDVWTSLSPIGRYVVNTRYEVGIISDEDNTHYMKLLDGAPFPWKQNIPLKTGSCNSIYIGDKKGQLTVYGIKWDDGETWVRISSLSTKYKEESENEEFDYTYEEFDDEDYWKDNVWAY